MNKFSFYIKITMLMVLSISLEAADIEKGKEISATCIACHGQEGVSPSSIWPNLAGQHASYLSKQLYEFKKGADGNRNNSIMYGISLALSDEDINILAISTSEIKLSVIIEENNILKAIKKLHTIFDLD